MSRYGPITYYTSQIYPIISIESVASFGNMSSIGRYYDNGVAEQMDATGAFLSGVLASSLFSYTTGLPEAVIQAGAFLAGAITNALVTYSNAIAEGVDQGQGHFLAGSWFVALVSYNNYPAEGCNVSADFIAGHLV